MWFDPDADADEQIAEGRRYGHHDRCAADRRTLPQTRKSAEADAFERLIGRRGIGGVDFEDHRNADAARREDCTDVEQCMSLVQQISSPLSQGAARRHEVEDVVAHGADLEQALRQPRLDARERTWPALPAADRRRRWRLDPHFVPERDESVHHLLDVNAFGAVTQRAMVIEDSHPKENRRTAETSTTGPPTHMASVGQSFPSVRDESRHGKAQNAGLPPR